MLRTAMGVGLFSAAIGAGLLALPSTENAQANDAPALPTVVASKPLVQSLDSRLAFLGQFSAVDRVELRAQVGGTLVGIHFKDGQLVKKGAVLFTIDRVPYDIRLAQAKALLQRSTARLAYAKSEYHRADELARNEAGSVQNMEQRKSEWQEAEAAVADANAQIRDAQFDLDHCQIVAPFTGRIGNHHVSVGNLVAGSRAAGSPTTLLATIVSQDPLYLDFDMSESDFQQYKRFRASRHDETADQVRIAPNGGHDYSTPGVLDFIDNALNRSSGTIHARATVPNPDSTLTPGEFARVQVIAAAAAPTLLVPDAAVLPDQSHFFVLTVGDDGVVAPKGVEVGEMRAGLRVIKSGLSANDRVMIGGLPFAAPGAKVNVKDGEIKADNEQVKD
ncbi:efflux RND transporter periplasmic adaptor subunit [Pseudomonas sp. GD03842]|uniref:efflux RND transporter periplasmic adaptor subunit n=1 Tax=Pseudomonas sp. GD03842 TaxID=2975385 RepID=UPI0024483B77|nr:efflux RND transporter periplasmic adaptor subunit [Pseudomonas sp. GD03842]MDH0745120.1 efflux RND transporter periplasmic adaptor subunit [Pseudomonas sp. GD03842]